jgi:hypothetical protein
MSALEDAWTHHRLPGFPDEFPERDGPGMIGIAGIAGIAGIGSVGRAGLIHQYAPAATMGRPSFPASIATATTGVGWVRDASRAPPRTAWRCSGGLFRQDGSGSPIR